MRVIEKFLKKCHRQIFLQKMQDIYKSTYFLQEIQVIEKFSSENASNRKIFYRKRKSSKNVVWKIVVIEIFSTENGSKSSKNFLQEMQVIDKLTYYFLEEIQVIAKFSRENESNQKIFYRKIKSMKYFLQNIVVIEKLSIENCNNVKFSIKNCSNRNIFYKKFSKSSGFFLQQMQVIDKTTYFDRKSK